ncbi:MAG: translocation/assembly module TamB domain-containing protein [Burkholderiaceae bacterium]|nr:translocation/assembly module TamB domain-containing protein [Burkholderiaceae bacterium]
MAARDALRWGTRALGVVLALLLIGATAALWWVGQSTSFLRWSLARAVQASDGALEVGTVRGTLLGGFRIDSLRWSDPTRDVQLDGLDVALRPAALLRGVARAGRIEIARAQVVLRPDGDDAGALPESLELPIDVRVDALGIGRLTIVPDAAGTAQAIVLDRVSFAGRYRNGAYRIDRFAVSSPAWGEAAVQGTLGATAPFDLEAVLELAPQVELASRPSLSLPRVRLLADGALADFSVVAQALPPAEPPSSVWIGLETRVRPFAPQLSEKLAPVELAFDAVEPSQFGLRDVPEARLSGSATLRLLEEGFEGELRLENANPGPLDGGRVPLRTLQGRFSWASSVLALRELQASLSGDASIDGTFTIDFGRPLAAFGHSIPAVRGEARLRAVDLSALQTQLEKTRLGGTVRAGGDRLELDLADASRENIGLAATLQIDGTTLRIDSAQLRSAVGTLTASGSATMAQPWNVDLAGRFVELAPARVEALLARLSVLDAPTRLQQWDGSIGGNWSARGRAWPDPALETTLAVESGELAGRSLRLKWHGDVSTTRIAKVAASLDYGGAQASLQGDLGGRDDRLRFSARVAELRSFDARATGSASAQGELRGGWHDSALGLVGRVSGRGLGWEDALRIASFDGRVDVPDLSRGRVDIELRAQRLVAAGRRVDRASARVDGDIGAHAVRIEAAGPDFSARLSAEGALARANDGASARGRDSLPERGRGEALVRGRDEALVRGRDEALVRGRDGGAWRWEGRLVDVEADRPIALRLVGPAPLRADGRGFSLGDSEWRIDGAALNLALLSWSEGSFAARGAAAALPVGRWVLRFAPDAAVEQAEAQLEALSLDAQWDLHGEELANSSGRVHVVLQGGSTDGQRGEADIALDEGRLGGRIDLDVPTLAFANRIIGPEWAVAGRLRFTGELGGTIRAPRVNGDLEGRSLALRQRELGWRLTDGALQARFEGDRLVLRQLRLESGDGAIAMSGTLLLDGLQGDFELRADRLPVPLGPGERIVVSGINAITSRGTALRWSGKLRVDEGRIELRGGEAPRLPDDVVIVGKDGEAPAAKATAAVAEEPEAGAKKPEAGAKKPEAGAKKPEAGAKKPEAGAKKPEAGAKKPEAVARKPEAVAKKPEAVAKKPAGDNVEADGGADGLRVAADLELDLGDKLRVRGSGVDVLLAGSLELRGVLPAQPLAYGTVRVAKGTYSAYGQELQITRGRVIFDGPIDNPVIDIVAMRLGTPVKAGVAVTGTVLSPRVRLVSEPEVPDAEKLSWLVLGVGFDDARSGAQMAALRAAAASLMGSGGGAGGLAHSLGLDVLTIRGASSGDAFDPDFGAAFPGQSTSGAPATGAAQNVVALGKRLSSRVLVTYEQGLRGVWNLLRIQYEITDRLSVRAQTGTDTALDLLYSFSFD